LAVNTDTKQGRSPTELRHSVLWSVGNLLSIPNQVLVDAVVVRTGKHHPTEEPQQVRLQVPAHPSVLSVVSEVLWSELKEPSLRWPVVVSKLHLRWLIHVRLDNPSKPS